MKSNSFTARLWEHVGPSPSPCSPQGVLILLGDLIFVLSRRRSWASFSNKHSLGHCLGIARTTTTVESCDKGGVLIMKTLQSQKGGGREPHERTLPMENILRPPSPRYVLPWLDFSWKIPLNFLQVPPQKQPCFLGSPNLVFQGPSSRGFALRYVLATAPLALVSNVIGGERLNRTGIPNPVGH